MKFNMKIGIISDIHGNKKALDIVLEELDKKNVDKIICLEILLVELLGQKK